MSAVSEAYTRLHDAMVNVAPDCSGDPRFIADGVEVEVVEAVCAGCLLFDLCESYATVARPTAGIWAGRRWAPKTYRPRQPKGDI